MYLVRGGYDHHTMTKYPPAKLTASSTLNPVEFYSAKFAVAYTKASFNHSGGWVAGNNRSDNYIQVLQHLISKYV